MSINFATDNYFEKSLRVKEAEEKQRALYKAPLSQQEDYNNSSELFTKETEIDFNNSLQSLAKRRSEAVEMYGQFYSNGVSYDVDGNPIYNQNAYDYADRLEFAELLHSLYPEYSVEYFVKNAESFMERATGVKHDISTWRNHIANTWNAAWASAASSLSDIGAFLSAGMTGAFGTEEWQEKKKELNFKKQKSGAGYRKDLADKKYSDIASLMISGTVSQAPQMASVLLLSALTGGTAGIAGTLASKGMITLSSAQTAVAVANGLGKAANFLVSGAMDAGNFMSELSDLGYSDEAALTGGLAILLSTGYLETLGDDQILKPVNKFADALVKNGNEGIVHDAVDGVLDYLKKAGWQAIKHVGASEITETVQEEVEYVNELFAKYLVDTYEKKHGNGKSLEELGLTKQQVVDGLIETAKQTALSTPLMTLGSSALSIGLDVAVGGASDSWKVPTYMNKEGATSTISTKNIIKDNLHVDKNLKGENDNSKANPISAHRVGNYIFVDGDISPEQENVIKTKKAVFIKDNLDSKVIKEDYKQLNSNSTDVKLKMTSAQADKVLASMETSNALSSYAYSDGKVVTGQYDNNTKELFINTNNQEQTLKIEINENTSLDDYINSVMGLSLITGTNLSQNLNSINTEASEEYENSREKRKKKESNENKTSEIKENETQETPEIKQDEAVSPQEEENEDSFFQDVDEDSKIETTEPEVKAEEDTDSDFDAWAGTKKENENLIDKEELVEEKRTVKDKAVSYDDFEYSKKKGKVVYETHEFVNEDGNAVTEKEKPYAIKLTKEDGTSDYVNISKLGNVKKNRIISLAKDSKVNIQENENNAVNEKAQNTETAKELVGITNVPVEISTAGEQKIASNTQNTQENNTNTVNETIENNTATTEQVQATTEETAQPTANEEATVEPEKNVKEDLTNIDFNKEVNKVIKETESTPVEAQDTVLVAKGIQDAAEQLGEDIPISDIVSKFTEKDVANLKNGKYLNNISSKVTKVIANTEFGKKLFRLMFGNDIEVNSTTTSQFKELFTSFLKGEKIEASEDVFNALTRLKDGILATYINNNTAFEGDTKVEAEVLNENKPINAEEVIPTQKTETEQAEESLKKTEPKTETQKVKISADALNKEWWSKNNRADNDYSEYHAFIMAHYAAEYYNDQYRMQNENNPEKAEYFKQLRNIYRDYRNGIYAGDINDAYDFLATNYALEAITLNGKEYKNSSGKEKTIKLEKEKTQLNRTTAIMSETVMKEYYSTRENRTPDEIGNQTISDKQLSKLQILFNDKYEQELDNIANDIVNSLVNEYEYLELKDIVPRLEAFLENRATIGELLGYMTKFNDALNEINPYTKDAIKEYRDNKTINMAIGKLIEASVKQELAKRYNNLKTKTRSEILEKVLYGYRNDKYKHLLDSKYDNSALNVIKTEVKQNEIIRYESSLKGHNEQSKEVGIYASSFEYDPKTKKYHFNADNLVNEIYQVFIANNNSEEDSIKAATVSSAFLSSYSEDVQDAIIRRSIDSNNKTKLLSGGNENLLRLFFANNEYIDKEGKSGLPDEVSGASLVNSAKIILSSQSDEQTVRHESTHLVWHTNEDFRNRAREEYGRLMSTDKGRLELTAVIDRNQERFATDVDETIRAFEYLISDKFDYQSEEARNAEEAIVAMSNIWWDGDDNVKNWSEGIKGVFERLANIIKTAFEHLKQFFNTDLVVDANDRVFAPLFENKEELHKFYDDIRNSSVDITENASERIMFEKVSQSAKKANDKKTAVNYEQQQQFEELNYQFITNKYNSVISSWRKSLSDTFVGESDIKQLSEALNAKEAFFYINNQNLTDATKSLIANDVARRIAYSTEDYITYANKLGAIKEKLKNDDGSFKGINSEEAKEALFALFGYRKTTTETDEGTEASIKPVGVLAKVFSNDARSSWGVWGNDDARGFNAIYNSFKKSLSLEQDNNITNETIANLLDKSRWKQSNTQSNNNTLLNSSTKYNKLNFKLKGLDLTTEDLYNFMSLMVNDKNPVAWVENDTTYGGVLHGPLIDLLNYAHLDSDALGSGFTLNTISSTNDMYIKSAYNSFRHSGISLAEGTFDSSFFLLDSVTSNLLKAIEKLNNKKLLGSLYGSNVTKDYYDNLQKSIQDIIDTNIENLDKLKDIKNSLQEDISLDDMFKIVNDINSALSQNITVSHVTNNAEINILKNNINNLQNSVESWKAKVEKLKLENKEKISEIKNNISSIKTERNVLENKLNKEIARNEELQNSINERVNTILNDILNLKSKKLTDEDTKKFAELYNSNISLLNEEISSLKKQNEKLQKSIDTSITKVDEQNKGAELTLKDMTDLGISELFANTVKEIRNTARNTAKADISKKLTALVDAIYSPIQKGKIRVVDVNKLFGYRSIYTANKSENYLDYLANVDELRTFVINKMLSRGTTKEKGVVTRTISDLTAGELAELSKLVQQVSSDSRKFFMDSVKKENEYHSNWRKAISREIVDFAKLRGKNINLLEVEDSIGSDDSDKKTKGITDIIREFELVSVKYRDRFPTLYSYLFGGVDMNGNYYGGLNEASNNVYRSYKERFDIFKNEFINDISGTTFHKGKITEKNLQYEMNEAKNGYKTKLQESTLSINNIGKYGIKVEEYTQEGKKKHRVVEDEKVKSPMKEVARYIANKYVESKNIELKNDRYNELYNKKLDEITKRTNAIEKAQKSLEEVRSSDKYADDVKNQLIDMYNKKIDTNQKEINHAKAIISGYSEKIAKNMTELSALNNTGERPNENLADYTAQQLVGIYLIARQKGGIDKLTFNPIDSNVNSSLSNNLSIGNIIWVMENFENNKEFAPLKKLADTMANMLGEKFEQIKDVKFRLSNGTVLLDPVDYYFTFITEESNPYTYGEDIDIDLFDKIAESGLTVDATKAKASDTMTKERHGGSKALNLNAVDNFVSSIYKQEYYINMAEKIDNLKKLVNDKDFQTAFRTYYGRNDGNKNIKQMSEYINRLGNNATDDNSILGKFTRFFTNTKAQSAMAFSLTTVAMQIPTMLWCLDNKYIGVSGVLKAMARAFTDKTLYKYSPQMQERANSAINSIRKSKNLGTLLGPQFEKAVHKIQNAGMWMLEETDKYIANAMWYAYFEGVRKEFNEKGIGTNLSEQKFLDLCANEATQRVMDISPVMNPKDNALIYSSKSAFVRSMLLFTNQTNKMLNGIVKSFRDKDIVKKRIARTLAVSGIMMLLTGLINGKMTKKPDDDDEPKALTILKNSASSIAEGFVDLIPYDIIGSDSVVNYNLYTATKNLFKVMAKDEGERTEHQLGNAWARMISEIAGTAGLPGNATMKVWRTVRDDNPLYLLNSTWANNFKGEE
ncbi:hypothetical protein [uncultured Pediococcus sp.]|uniref:hypothetical protein n=1 Tax=uncultured Pediococcus sp. TaxID=165192 RepID=UPI00259BA7A8|nr:hypothetical protein [uncultured Pediococcus sp.]